MAEGNCWRGCGWAPGTAYQYAIHRPAAMTPTQAMSETQAATLAPIGARGESSHFAMLRNAVFSKISAFTPASTIRSILTRKAPFSYILDASEANIKLPLMNITAKPV